MIGQTKTRLSKKDVEQEEQQQKSIETFKDATWLHKQFHGLRFWRTAKIAYDEYEKNKGEGKRKTYTREQILIVYIGLDQEEAHHPWSKDGKDYGSLELLEWFVNVCIPLTKKRNLPEVPPIKHPRLPKLPTLDTLAKDVANYYTNQAKNDNEVRMTALKQVEKEEQMGIWD